MRDFQTSLELLRKLGLQPKTVVDAGVAHGTPSLYKTYPDAYYFLFEPIEEFKPHLEKNLKIIKGEYHMIALANREGKARISSPEKLGGASIMSRSKEGRVVPQTTLDQFFSDKTIETPLLIKTDCQGADLLVMKGAVNTLKHCDAAILEVPMAHYFSGNCPDFTDVVSWMGRHGFRVFDLVDPLNRSSDGALGQIDVVFVKENSPIITDARW